MIKLFDSIASLEFAGSKTSEKKVAAGMHAKDGEYVKFNKDCDCSGPVSKIVFENTFIHKYLYLCIYNKIFAFCNLKKIFSLLTLVRTQEFIIKLLIILIFIVNHELLLNSNHVFSNN